MAQLEYYKSKSIEEIIQEESTKEEAENINYELRSEEEVNSEVDHLYRAFKSWGIVSRGDPIDTSYPIPSRPSYLLTGPRGMSSSAHHSEMDIVAEIHPEPGTSASQPNEEPREGEDPQGDIDQESVGSKMPPPPKKGLQHLSRFTGRIDWTGIKEADKDKPP